MPKKHYYLTIFSLLFLALALLPQAVLALEISYPELPVLGYKIDEDSRFVDFFLYFFGLAVVSAGILATLSIAIAGAKLIFKSGNPSAAGEARERVLGSVLGMILVLASFMVLKTINPDLLEPVNPQVPLLPGVHFVTEKEGGGQKKVWPATVPSRRDIIKFVGHTTKLIYRCDPGSINRKLLVWHYPFKPYGPAVGYDPTAFNDSDPEAGMIVLECAGEAELNVTDKKYGYVKLAFEDPGIYLYMKDNCEGVSTDLITSTGAIPGAFHGKVRSARIVNGYSLDDSRFGFVLNSTSDIERDRGYCSHPFMHFEAGDIGANTYSRSSCFKVLKPSKCNVESSSPEENPSGGSSTFNMIPRNVSHASLAYARLAQNGNGDGNGEEASPCPEGFCSDPTADNWCPFATGETDDECVRTSCNNKGQCVQNGGGVSCDPEKNGENDFNGKCGGEGDENDDSQCEPFANSIYVIKSIDTSKESHAKSVGDGISIYESGGKKEDESGWWIGPYYVPLSTAEIGARFTLDGNPNSNKLKADWTNPNDLLASVFASPQFSGDTNDVDTCRDRKHGPLCTEGVEYNGRFLTILYGKNQGGGDKPTNYTCDFFPGSFKLLKIPTPYIVDQGRVLYRMDIFPLAP